MAERASIFELFQIGPESPSTPGTAVAAGKRLQAYQVTVNPQVDIKKYTGSGAKFATLTALAKDWAEVRLSGPLTYTDIAYPLCGILGLVSPTGATLAKTWVHAPNSFGPDAVTTFTCEFGSSVRAMSFAYGLFTDLTLNFSRDECTVDATMLGRALADGITLTSTPTAVALVPATPVEVAVSVADTQANLAAAAALTRALSGSWALTGKAAPLWALPSVGVTSSYAAHVETAPTIAIKLMLEADAAGMGLLTNLRANSTKWLRIKWTTAAFIEEAIPYSLTIDTPVRVVGDALTFSDSGGVYAAEWTLEGVHDGTWAKACQVTLVTTVAAL